MGVVSVGSGSTWDAKRNTSQVFGVPPDALPKALAALRAFRLSDEAHYAWIVGGARTLTEAEHVARFGQPYRPHAKRAKG